MENPVVLSSEEVQKLKELRFSELTASFLAVDKKTFVVVTSDRAPSDARVKYGTGRLMDALMKNHYGMMSDCAEVFEDLKFELEREDALNGLVFA